MMMRKRMTSNRIVRIARLPTDAQNGKRNQPRNPKESDTFLVFIHTYCITWPLISTTSVQDPFNVFWRWRDEEDRGGDGKSGWRP
jgi:hypothetical protein